METQDISKEILNDIEREKVQAFCEDPVLYEAVKKYILAVSVKHGVFKEGEPFKGNMNWALQIAWGANQPGGIPRSDEELGQDLRALTKAVQLVESGFREMTELKEVEELPEDNKNPAE